MDIKTQIGQILYERDSLIIPNLGGFVSSYKSATIDHVQGLISPPSKKLNFNKNLIINDGVLISCLQESLGLSLQEAQKAIEDFVHRTSEMLDNREIILFPGVGRLYKDYENNIQFLQDNTNYNTAVYGLPTVQFYPILRAKAQNNGQMASDVIGQQQSAGRSINYRRVANVLMPFVIVAIILSVAIVSINPSKDSSSIADAKPVVNVSPKTMSLSPDNLTGNRSLSGAPEIEASTKSEMIELEEVDDTEAATLRGSKECVIIIGAFGKQSGVEKRVGQIIDLGYSVYQDKKGKLTRVGIQFAYQEEDEIREKLEAMRDNFDNHAWILEEGE